MVQYKSAIVIGTNYGGNSHSGLGDQLERAGIHTLRYAESDALSFGDLLEASDYDVEYLLAAAATRANIIKALERFRDTTGPEWLLVVYFAGHGKLGTNDARPYLLPVDFDSSNLSATAIPLGNIIPIHLTALQEYSVGTVVVVLDCCYSGEALVRGSTASTTRRRSPEDILARTGEQISSNMPGRVLLTACGLDEKSREYDQLRGGIFTYYFMKYWREHEEVDLDLIYSSVARNIGQNWQSEGVALPMRGGLQQGAILLRSPGAGLQTATHEEVEIGGATMASESQDSATASEDSSDQDPELVETRKWGTSILKTLAMQFKEMEKEGNRDSLIAKGNDILLLDHNYEPVRTTVIALLTSRGMDLMTGGDAARAIGDFSSGLALDPESKELYYDRGRAYLMARRYDEARDDLIESTTLDGTQPNYFFNLAEAYVGLRKYAEAVWNYRKAINLLGDAPNGDYHLRLGQAYEEMGTPTALELADLNFRYAKALQANGAIEALIRLQQRRAEEG